MRDKCAALATRLQTVFRCEHNDVVAVCLPNIPEFPIATLAVTEAGLIITTVNPSYTPGKYNVTNRSGLNKYILFDLNRRIMAWGL